MFVTLFWSKGKYFKIHFNFINQRDLKYNYFWLLNNVISHWRGSEKATKCVIYSLNALTLVWLTKVSSLKTHKDTECGNCVKWKISLFCSYATNVKENLKFHYCFVFCCILTLHQNCFLILILLHRLCQYLCA